MRRTQQRERDRSFEVTRLFQTQCSADSAVREHWEALGPQHQGLIIRWASKPLTAGGRRKAVDRVVKLLHAGPVRWMDYRAGIPGPLLKEMIGYDRPPERRDAMLQAVKTRWITRRPP